MQRASWLALAAALALAACTGKGPASVAPAGPPAALADASAAAAQAAGGTPLPAGQLVGKVGRYDGAAFTPAAGVAVTLEDPALSTTTDAQGRYGFTQVPAGVRKLHVELPDQLPFTLVCRLGSLAGLAGANLLVVPAARPAALAAGDVAMVGVLADPRGAALAGGTVHAVDGVSNGGKGSNQQLTADADGFFAMVLTGIGVRALNNGQAELTGYGRTAGGVNVETTDIQTLTVDTRPTQATVVGTTAFLAVSGPVWGAGTGQTRTLTADHLPTRRDELELHFEQDGKTADVLPDAIAGSQATFTLPAGFTPGHGTLEPRVLGLVPAPSLAIGP